MEHLTRVKIEGYKSIKKCDIELKNLNILIGANGAGKSNFISFFKMINAMTRFDYLKPYIAKKGGASTQLHFGRKKTKEIKGKLCFSEYSYEFSLAPTSDDELIVLHQKIHGRNGNFAETTREGFEALFAILWTVPNGSPLDNSLTKIRIYHFNDTSESALIKQKHNISDGGFLRADARNLAAFLMYLKFKYEKHYRRIVETIQLVAPFFDDFVLEPDLYNEDTIQLQWQEKGHDVPFKAFQLSDGTLRFMCLVALLLQPKELQPDLIIIDEPELGLHPLAITILAELIESASFDKQVIISTQSAELLNEFKPEDVIVADREGGETLLRRLDDDELAVWLEDYSLGEIWNKNILGGRPS